MTVTRGVALFWSCCWRRSASTISRAAGTAATIAGASSRPSRREATLAAPSLVIEATEPVPYVATRPDPLTVVARFPQRRCRGRRVGQRRARQRADRIAWLSKPPSRWARRSRACASRSRSPSRITSGPSATASSSISIGPTPVTASRRSRRRCSRQSNQSTVQTRCRPARRAGARTGHAPRSQPGARAAAGCRCPRRRRFRPPPPLALQAPAAGRCVPTTPAAGDAPYTGNPVSLDFQGADLRAVLRVVRRDQRPQHRDRPGGAGHGRRRAARRAVGPGARHHPARQQARLHRRRHDRAHRAADRARRRRDAAPQARRRAGAGRRAAAC